MVLDRNRGHGSGDNSLFDSLHVDASAAFAIGDDTDTVDDTYEVEVLVVVVVMEAEDHDMMLNYADTLDRNRALLLPLQRLPSVKKQ